jgi:hypothetical protein
MATPTNITSVAISRPSISIATMPGYMGANGKAKPCG